MPNKSQLIRFPALTFISLFLAGCISGNNDWQLFGGKDSDANAYTWNDFLKDTDSNGSKTVEADEFTDYLARQGGTSENVTDTFSEMDVDTNGSIEESEFNTRPSEKRAAEAPTVLAWLSFLTHADRNDDGTLSEQEWSTVSRKLENAPKRDEFRRYDIDGDGQVTRTEYEIAGKQ